MVQEQSVMRVKTATGWILATAVTFALAAPAVAQTLLAQATPAQTAPSQTPAPPVGQAWTPSVKGDPQGAGLTLDAGQVEALKKVSLFFNELKQLKGNFTQTAPDGKRLRGKFSLKQPGRFRFDYGFGSKLVIISDGTTLAVQDKDISTDDRLELDRTPFRILLRKDVDILRDGRVFEVQEVDDLIIVSMGDKSPDAPGRIRLFLTKKPALELKEWVTTDAQGGDTRVEVSEPNRTEALSDTLFKIESNIQQKIQ
jgi:outer membrane lipoprotein-sorting protein